MRPVDAMLHASGGLLRRKVRTLLTAFGVAVGVSALVLLVSLAIGVKVTLVEQFQTDTMLTTVVVNRPLEEAGPAKRNSPFPSMGRQDSDPMGDEDISEIGAIDGVVRVYPYFGLFLHTYPTEGSDEDHFPLWICGIPEGERADLRGALLAGDFWADGETDKIVIPSAVADFIEMEDPAALVGREIRFKRKRKDEPYRFTVVGVADSMKMGFRGNQVLMPLPRCREMWVETKGGIWSSYDPDDVGYPRAFVRVAGPADVDRVKTTVRNAGYQALSVSDILEALDTIFVVIEAFMALVGGVGLVVGFFGIANTMAMCVLERTREIGIMKSIGSTNRTILGLFLFEAAGLGFLGGAIGVLIGWLGGLLLNVLSRPLLDVEEGIHLFHTSPWLAAGALGFAILTSMLAGLVPAMRAARMAPVEALRYE